MNLYRILSVSRCFWLFGIVWVLVAAALSAQTNLQSDWTGNTLLVQFQPTDSRSEFDLSQAYGWLAEMGVERLLPMFPNYVRDEIDHKERLPDLSLMYRAYLRAGASGLLICQQLGKNPAIKRAELEPRDSSHFYQPNDSLILAGQHWPDLIRAFDAWSITRGDTSVVIGIVDTAFDLDHPDLVDALYINFADPINGIDDDRDGHTDNYYGWDFGGSNDLDPQPDNDPSVVGHDIHGSWVSGAAAARSDNRIGTASPGFQAKFLAIKANSDNSSLVTFGYEGIVYAAMHGCKIINCSWGSRLRSEIRQEIINYVVRRYGVLIVASVGNNDQDVLFYPASYDNVLAVGATDLEDRKSPASNFTHRVSVLAPSQWTVYPSWNDIYQTDRLGTTSISAALVSSSAALLQAYYPDWNGQQLGEQLRMTADEILTNHNDSLQQTYRNKLGRGRINLYRALTEQTPSVRLIDQRLQTASGQPTNPGDTAELVVTLRNFLQSVSNLELQLSTESLHLSVIRSTLVVPRIETLQELTVADRFVIRLAESIPPNTIVWMRIDFESGTYRDFQYFQLLLFPTFIDFEYNRVGTSLNSVGNFGYNGTGSTKQGLGFRLNGGASWLFDAGLIVSERSDRVFDNIRTTFPNLNSDDFQTDSLIRTVNPIGGATAQAFTQYTEKVTGGQRLTIRQYAYAWNDGRADESILLTYEIKNNTSERMDSIHVGLFADWDVGTAVADWNRNSSRYDSTHRLNYTFLERSYIGMAALGDWPTHVRNIRFGEVFRFDDENKYIAISSGIQQTELNEADVMSFLGAGPITLNSGETRRIAFVLTAGHSLADLQRNVRRQQVHFDCLFSERTTDLQVSLPNPPRLFSLPNRIEACQPAQYVPIPVQARGLAINQRVKIRAVTHLIDPSAQAGRVEVPQPILSLTDANGFHDTLFVVWYPNPQARSRSRLEIQLIPVDIDPLRLNCEAVVNTLELEDTTLGLSLLEVPPAMCIGEVVNIEAPFCSDCRYEWYCDGLFEGRSFGPTWQARRPGRWLVRIENRSGCLFESRPAVLVENQGPVILGLEVIEQACRSGDSLRVAVRTAGGLAPYRYSFNDGPVQTEASTRVAPSQTVRFQVIDAAGCVDESIDQISALHAGELRITSLFVGRSGCSDCNQGFMIPHVSGGRAPYRYFLNEEERGRNDLRGLVRGDWTLRIVDAAGCSIERVVVIRE